MKRILILTFLSVLTYTYSFSQDDNNVIKDDEMKIQFTVPDGWHATKKGDRYIMGSENTEGFMLIEVQNFKTLKKLTAAMESGIEQEDGSKMTPVSTLNKLGGQGVSGLFEGKIDETEMQGFLMALMPPSKRRAAICLTVAPKTSFNQSNMDQLKILLRSVIFL